MRAYRILALLFVAVLATAVTPAVASAQPYPAGVPAAGVSSGSTTVGNTVRFTGSGFAAGEKITIYVNGRPVKTVTASAEGTFSTTVTLTEAGTADLLATGQSSGVSVSATVTVKSSKVSNAGDDLPTTGMSARRLAIAVFAGSAALVVGAALIWLAYARRRRQPTDA